MESVSLHTLTPMYLPFSHPAYLSLLRVFPELFYIDTDIHMVASRTHCAAPFYFLYNVMYLGGLSIISVFRAVRFFLTIGETSDTAQL